jgi:hypothetical protein
MTSHKDRMEEIGFWAIPSRTSPLRADFEKRMKEFAENPQVKKEVKKNYDKAIAVMLVQQVNGIGFPADKMLREYNEEYNSRVLNGGLEDLPGSFNVVEAFQKFIPPSATFEILSEVDNLFSFDDFIDELTSSEEDFSDDNVTDFTQEGIVYSYNSTSDPKYLKFSTCSDKSYGFSSVSFVRFGNEVSMILLAGRICDLKAESQKIKEESDAEQVFPHRAHIQPDSEREIRAEPLFEGSDLWKTIVLIRFDIATKTIDVRYIYEDWGRLYHGKTDDRNSYLTSKGEFINGLAETAYQKAKKSLAEYDTLIELCKTCLVLPKYFSLKEDDTSIEKHPTDFLEFRKKLSNKKYLSLAHIRLHTSYRNVNVLRKKAFNNPDKSEFFAPKYKIETTGFWRKLPPTSIGRDKDNKPIHGRTWVSQTESWVEEADTSVAVSTEHIISSDSPNAGYIYVMRSAAHQKNIFKVGLTRRDSFTRASELTRTTGSPDHFLVVQEWMVGDCVLAERLIHEKLDSYRINPKREFFLADYAEIRSAIDSIVAFLEKKISK